MKKSNKQKINPEELIKETDRLFKFIDNLDNINLETIDIKILENEINSIEKNLKEKYKDILPENPEDYLDIKE
jgi:hypothetical protein|tara:strand:+ start:450 stop:668 length:219 start_codon:yes stop_codon:yes gene_type:complete